MDALHRPVAHSGGAQRAAIAAAVAENPPGVAKPVTVLPGRPGHVEERIGMLLVYPVRNDAHPVLGAPAPGLLLGERLGRDVVVRIHRLGNLLFGRPIAAPSGLTTSSGAHCGSPRPGRAP